MRNTCRPVFAMLAFAVRCLGQSPPPVAPVRAVTDDYFGTKVVDGYRWMENLEDPQMKAWMKSQADYTRSTLDALPGYPSLLRRVSELEVSQPESVGNLQIVAGRYYTLRTPAGAQTPKLSVREGVDGKDRLLIDPDRLSAAGGTHLSLHGYSPSPDGRYIAYQLSAGGSEESVLHIFDVQAGKDLRESADRAYGDPPFWLADSRSFFYPRGQKLEAGMPATAKFENVRVYLHRLGRAFESDPAILGRGVNDASVPMTPVEFAEIVTSPNSRYAIAFVSPGTDPRLRVYAAPVESVRDGKTAWRPVAANYDDQYIAGDNSDKPTIALTGDTLFWPSLKNAPRGEILKLDLSQAEAKPERVVAEGDLPISAVYAGRAAIYWRVSDAGVNAVHRLRLAKGAQPETLSLPYPGDVTVVHSDLLSDAVILAEASWLRSSAYLSVDPRSGFVVVATLEPSGRFDRPDDLVAEEVKVKSWDDTEVPLSIIHKVGLTLDGRNLTMVIGYGAYGISSSPFYIPEMRVWYDRGGVVAVAHVRGGGELGEAWHQGGFQATKPNTWRDYIACAQYLVDRQYTNSRKLVGFAQSAGGIMIGRAIEERPELFAAAIIRVPSADPLRAETTASGPENTPEFGSVASEQGFRALHAMSAYANAKDGTAYPAVIIYAGANDQRVAAWIPAKLAARLQAATTSGKPVLLRVDYDAGHTGFDATRRQEELNTADMMSFALWQTGDTEFQPRSREP